MIALQYDSNRASGMAIAKHLFAQRVGVGCPSESYDVSY